VTLLSKRFGTITWFCHVVFSFCLQTEMSQVEGHSFSLGSGRLSTWNRAAADLAWTHNMSKKTNHCCKQLSFSEDVSAAELSLRRMILQNDTPMIVLQ